MVQSQLDGSFHLNVAVNKNRYVPDLQGFMVLCEQNYVRLLKLLPQIEPSGHYFDYCINDNNTFRLTIKECCKYTTIVTVAQLTPKLADYLMPTMEARLYHDANMAEVTASQNINRIQGTYQYPNKAMMHKDEKYQINRFLHDWLRLCLAKGQISVDLSSF
jgi:uncharacterized protein YqiB (DUF1249 family)